MASTKKKKGERRRKKINWIFIPFLQCICCGIVLEGHFSRYKMPNATATVEWTFSYIKKKKNNFFRLKKERERESGKARKKIHHQLEMKNYAHLISRGYIGEGQVIGSRFDKHTHSSNGNEGKEREKKGDEYL